MSEVKSGAGPSNPSSGADPSNQPGAEPAKPTSGAEPSKPQNPEPATPVSDDDDVPTGAPDIWNQGYNKAKAKYEKQMGEERKQRTKLQSDFEAFQARFAEQDTEVQTLRKVKQDHTLLSRDFELTKKELEAYRKTEWEGLEAEAAKVLPEKLRGVLDPYKGKDAAKYRENLALLVETQKGQSSPGGAATTVRATPKWDVRRLRDEAVAGKQDYQRELIAQGVTAQQMKDELGALGSG